MSAQGTAGELHGVMRAVTEWSAERPEVLAVALAGSRARGEPHPGSDVDLVILVDDPDGFPVAALAERLGAARPPVRVAGECSSNTRLVMSSGLEIDAGVAAPAWTAARPVDAGTARLVAGGFVVLYDPHDLLGGLLAALRSG